MAEPPSAHSINNNHATANNDSNSNRQFTTTTTSRFHQRRHSSQNSTASVRANDILKTKRSRGWRYWQQFRLLRLQDLFFSVELTSMWRRHLVWSHKGTHGSKELLDIVTSRFASTQIFLSLLFAAEVGTYYSPSRIVTDVRDSLRTGPFEDSQLEYATGIILIISIILTGSAVLANYTALGVFRCVGQENAAAILRSDIGLYATTLPSRLTFFSVLTFLTWNVGFWWINVQDETNTGAIILTLLTVGCITHVISTFSAVGRLIMATSAMGQTPILPKGEEELLLPHELSNVLLTEAVIARKLKTKVNRQYHLNTNQDQHEPINYVESLRRRHPDIVIEEIV